MIALAQDIARQFSTPALVVDLDIVEANIARMQALCDRAGIANRPHIKTHKSPLLARMQRDAGAQGITCQKLGEAEVMAQAGLNNILISYNILGEEKVSRLGRLLRSTKVTVAADNPVTIRGLTEAAMIAGRDLDVVIECDTGLKRAGVETPQEAVELARLISSLPGLQFAGFLMYPPVDAWFETQRFLDEALQGLRSHGLEARIISTGGSPNIPNIGQISGVTEHRAGTYIFNDRMQIAAGVATLKDCALRVYSTVVSRAGAERGILDAGSKTLTSDTGGLSGHGLILEYPQAKISKFAEEHGFLDLSDCRQKPEIGEIVSIIPNHVCVAVNMVDRLIGVRGTQIIGEIPVTARGQLT